MHQYTKEYYFAPYLLQVHELSDSPSIVSQFRLQPSLKLRGVAGKSSIETQTPKVILDEPLTMPPPPTTSNGNAAAPPPTTIPLSNALMVSQGYSSVCMR
jgi:hypothetical protein